MLPRMPPKFLIFGPWFFIAKLKSCQWWLHVLGKMLMHNNLFAALLLLVEKAMPLPQKASIILILSPLVHCTTGGEEGFWDGGQILPWCCLMVWCHQSRLQYVFWLMCICAALCMGYLVQAELVWIIYHFIFNNCKCKKKRFQASPKNWRH